MTNEQPTGQEPEYIITEKRLKDYEDALPRYIWVGNAFCKTTTTIAEIYARPYTPAPEQIPTAFIIDAGLRANVVETLRRAGCPCLAEQVLEKTMPDYHIKNEQATRNEVLDELRLWAESNSFRIDACSVNMLYTYKLADKLESLRAGKEEP